VIDVADLLNFGSCFSCWCRGTMLCENTSYTVLLPLGDQNMYRWLLLMSIIAGGEVDARF
jgi:hypothetical protein